MQRSPHTSCFRNLLSAILAGLQRSALLLALILPITLTAQVPTNGLIGYWPFSGSANDASGNGHHGTVYGPTLVEDRFRNTNRAYSFDGINDSIIIPHHFDFSFDSATSFSISLWFKTCKIGTTNTADALLFGKDDPDPHTTIVYAIMYLEQIGRVFATGAGGGDGSNDGKWHHCALIISDTVPSVNARGRWAGLYVDGQLVGANPQYVVSYASNTGDLFIGGTSIFEGVDQFFEGAIDDIRVYNRALSSTEVAGLYGEGGWPVTPDTTITSTFTALDATTICPGESVQLRIEKGNADGYVWKTLSGISGEDTPNPVASPSGSVVYEVSAYRRISGEPCSDTVWYPMQVAVTVLDPPKAVAGTAQFVCLDDTVRLGGQTTGGLPPYQWQWTPTAGLSNPNVERPELVVTKSERYKMVVTDAKGCQDSAEVSVTFLPSPELDLGADTVYWCRGEAGVELGAEATGGNSPYVYTWSVADGLDRTDSAYVLARPPKGTTYIVEVRDVGGCRAIDSVTVLPVDGPSAAAGKDTAICSGGSARLGGDVVSGLEYSWSPATGLDNVSSSNPTARPPTTTMYTLTVRDLKTGCTSTDDVEVRVQRVELRSDPSSVDFGLLDGCTPDAVRTIRIYNDGESTATLDDRSVDNGSFTLLGGSVVVPGGGSVEVRVRYAPQGSGSHSGVASLRGAPCGAEVQINVSGSKEETVIGADVGSVDFGSSLLCEVEAEERRITITNSGSVEAELDAAALSAPFSVVGPGLPVTIGANSSVEIVVRYAPVGAGVYSEELRLPFAAGECKDTIRVTLSGEVIEPTLDLGGVQELDFGVLDGCTTEKDTVLTLTNSSSVEISIERIDLPAGYRVLNSLPITVDGNSSVALRVRYVPVGTGVSGGPVSLNYEPCSAVLGFDVVGEKQGVTFTVTDAIDFGEVALCEGEVSLPLEILLQGESGDGSISSVVVAGPFTTTVSAGAVLRDGQTENFEVRFAPAVEGDFTERLLLRLEPCGVEREVAVRGRAVRSELTAVNLNFGTVGVSSVQVGEVVFRNTGTSAVRVESLAGVVAPFSVVSTTPMLPATLGVGEELRVEIEYSAVTGVSQSPVEAVLSSPCELRFAGEVRGEGESSARAKIVLPELRSRAGERVRLDLVLSESSGLDGVGAKAFEAEVSFDASLLVVSDNTVWSDDAQGLRRTVVVQGERVGETGIFGSVELMGVLGRAEATDLRLDRFEWVDATGPVAVETESGEYVLEGLCRTGGVRLYDPRGEVGIKQVSPNPVSDKVGVAYSLSEPGSTRMVVVDSRGREVREVFSGELLSGAYIVEIGVAELESGIYWLVLETPTVVLSERLVVVK